MPKGDFDPRFRCKAKSTTTGDQCRRRAAPGCEVCTSHGGKAPQVRAAGERRLAEEQAARRLVTYGLPREVDPHTALLEELHRTAGHVAWLGELVASLHHADDPDPTVLGNGGSHDPTEAHAAKSGLKQYTRTERFTVEQESVWLRMYRDERAHLAKVAKDCIAAGIAERQVEIEQEKVNLLAVQVLEFVKAIVPALGEACGRKLDLHSPEVRAVVEPQMRRLSAVA